MNVSSSSASKFSLANCPVQAACTGSIRNYEQHCNDLPAALVVGVMLGPEQAIPTCCVDH